MRFRELYLVALAFCLLACGCPQQNEQVSEPKPGDQSSAMESEITTTSTDGVVNKLNPELPIPEDEPLSVYAGLTLGMNSFELAQVYPAPEGRGVGFSRVIEDYGDVQHHIIAFDVMEGEHERRIVASLYRDQLYLIIDRRDGVSDAQIDEWRNECFETYGNECRETINGAQWTWDGRDGITIAFTQDNAAPDYMDAHVIVAHAPTQTAAHAYLELREEHEENK